jgi:mono/diheme cytochrome c family protein
MSAGRITQRIGMRRLAVLLTAAGAVAVARADDPRFTSATAPANASGADVYAHICEGCHMAQGQGAIGAGHYPKLAGDAALVSWQYVAMTVLNGKNGMPAFGLPEDPLMFFAVHLSDAQVAEVVNYVRAHFGNRWKGKVTAAQVAGLPHPVYTSDK